MKIRTAIGAGVGIATVVALLHLGGCASGQTAPGSPAKDAGACVPDDAPCGSASQCCSLSCSNANLCVHPRPPTDGGGCNQVGESCQGPGDCCNGDCQKGTCAAPGCAGDASDDCDGEASAPTPTVDCPTSPCPAGHVCCADTATGALALSCAATQCPGGQSAFECAGPAACGPGAPYCCGTFELVDGSDGNCSFPSASTTCTATCLSSIAATCAGADAPRLCTTPADCDSQHGMCCLYPIDGQPTIRVCVDSAQQALLGTTCM